MSMWKITVAPEENLQSWNTYVQQGIVAIGWPSREYDSNNNVRRFRRISVGDWVVAHVPASHGGGDTLARAVGRVNGPYIEMNKNDLPVGDDWEGSFRRQYSVRWTIRDHPLRGILKSGQYRFTVVELSPQQERKILELYQLD